MHRRGAWIGVVCVLAGCRDKPTPRPVAIDPAPTTTAPLPTATTPPPRAVPPSTAAAAASTTTAVAASASAEPADAEPVADEPGKPGVVTVSVMLPDQPQSAVVRPGETLEVILPLYIGTEWSAVGDHPGAMDHVERWLGPSTHGQKFIWPKVTWPKGKRVLTFKSKDLNDPTASGDVVRVTVEVR